ncbi:MAG: hypothetical protein ACTMHL_11090 [Janibacter sp.]
MTDRHDDESWASEDDELVRQALLSLMDDVSAEPLPEPARIRARAESGSVVDLDSRRRRRSMTVLAGAAAAVMVATGAGLLVVNQSPDTPVATSTSPEPTGTSTSGTAAPSRLTPLGPAEWQTFLGVPVDATEQGEPDTHCFQPADGSDWVSRSARQADGSRIAGQWVGTSAEGTAPLTASVDQSVEECDGWSRDRSMSDSFSGEGTVRAWRASGPDDVTTWWVEVSDGESVSFLSVPESDGNRYTDDDMRTLALGVLGRADLTRPSSTSSTTTPRSSTSTSSSAPPSTSTSTSTSAPTTTSTTSDPTTTSPESSSSSTSGSSTTRPTPPPISPTPPDPSVPVVGTVDGTYFVPPSSWASQTLTGGTPSTGGTLRLEGRITVDSCVSTAADDPIGGVGVRSGPGEDNFFGRQYIFKDKTAQERSERHRSVLASYRTNCSGTGTPEVLGEGRFKMTVGDATTYVAVTRLRSGGTSIIRLNQPKTAPKPLTDSSALKELDRLSGLAARR